MSLVMIVLLLTSTAVAAYDLSFLASGCDIRGTFVDDLTGLNPTVSYCLGRAFAKKLGPYKTILLGRDPRTHGEVLTKSFCSGFLDENSLATTPSSHVKITGLATTPSVFHSCLTGFVDGGVMITASHLPKDRNGLKIFTKDGPLSVKERDDLLKEAGRIMDDCDLDGTHTGEGFEIVNFMSVYVSFLVDFVNERVGEKGLAGLKILVNSGGGSGYFLVDVLEQCGSDVSSSINLSPNGSFPKGPPNPENKNMVKETIEACEREKNVDLAIMLDTDGDRVGFITPSSTGEYVPLNRNRFVAVMAAILANSRPEGEETAYVVTDSVTSTGLEKFVNGLPGMRMMRFKKGYMNVINEAKRLCKEEGKAAELAIETSGHSAFRANNWMDDGTYSAVVVVCELAKRGGRVNDMIAGLEEASFEEELRLQVLENETSDVYAKIEAAVRGDGRWMVDELNKEGVRLVLGGEWGSGWFMLRPSLHDPVVSMQVECDEGVAAKLVSEVRNVIFGAVGDNVSYGDLDAIE